MKSYFYKVGIVVFCAMISLALGWLGAVLDGIFGLTYSSFQFSNYVSIPALFFLFPLGGSFIQIPVVQSFLDGLGYYGSAFGIFLIMALAQILWFLLLGAVLHFISSVISKLRLKGKSAVTSEVDSNQTL